ncbi:MAG: methylmalonyl-CoA mutase family protein [Vicinamibacterales bacterium]
MKGVIQPADTARALGTRTSFEPTLAKSPERKGPFTTILGKPIERLHRRGHGRGLDYGRDIGSPGEFPYVRGIHPSGYRGKLWTMRQFAGFGTPEETNQRYKDLIAAGGTGLSVAFDLPTLMGRDPDHPLSLGEVGKCGVNITSLADMERLFEDPLADITTSMTINLAGADDLRDVPRRRREAGRRLAPHLSGTIQNDIPGRSSSPRRSIFLPRPSMRLITDIFSFCAAEVPKWNTIR